MGRLPGALWEPAQGFPPSPSVVDPVVGYVVASTALTAVLACVAPETGGYTVRTVLVVSTAATTVTAYVTWTDPAGQAQRWNWLSSVVRETGNHALIPLPISALSGTGIILWLQAMTASQVWVTATIEKFV